MFALSTDIYRLTISMLSIKSLWHIHCSILNVGKYMDLQC